MAPAIPVVGRKSGPILYEYFKQALGNLKAYTAVLEYLADWTVVAPAGLVFYVRNALQGASVTQTFPQVREGGLRIAWLSDLHVAAEDKTVPGSLSPLKQHAWKVMQFKATPLTQHFQLRNVQTILSRVQTLTPDHILVTGDVTNYARESQFKAVHDQFMGVQAAIKRPSIPLTKLDQNLWTILPGNHDVTNEDCTNDPVRPNLGLFFKWFGTADNGTPSVFPIDKALNSKSSGISVRLLGLDSTVSAPVWRIGVNARGRVDREQLDKLSEKLSEAEQANLTLVALHHHPMAIPELASDLEDYFLSLNEADGRQLIKLCANTNVTAILHGHYHRLSTWSSLTPHNRQMVILGSPAGTVNIPGIDEQFVELREAERESSDGVQQGLAVYIQRHKGNGEWIEAFTGTFLPSA